MATMKDVAKDAGVALGTVSKVVNGLYVSETNRIKVQESIERLGYQVNYYARGLKAQYTNTVAVIVPDILNPFFAMFVYYAEKALYRSDYKMLLCHSQGDVEKEAAYMKLVGQNKVDGIIGVTYNETDPYVSKGMPLVTLDRHFEEGSCCVSSDNYGGGRLAAETLVKKGCRSLIYVRTGSQLNSETLKRKEGFADYCRENQICHTILDMGDDTHTYYEGELYAFFKKHYGQGSIEYDGIFASTDTLAIRLMKQLLSLGIKIPEEIQIVGYDGIPQWQSGERMVSSIEQPMVQLAEKCVENVLKMIHGQEVEDLSVLPVRFVEGGTTRR